MNTNFNKKKISLFPNRKIIKYFFISFIFISFGLIIYNEFITKDRFYNIIQNISEKFNYQFINLEINSLNRVKKSAVVEIFDKYKNKSIFLIPLDNISELVNELKWVKNVNLSSNFKNKINIEIFEYKPLGLFSYNNQLFYFSSEGKIIDLYKENKNENLIIFYGKSAEKEANNFLKNLNLTKYINLIQEAHYINQRRWDVKLYNGIYLNLSEKNIEESVKNYIKIIKKFNKSEILTIKNIDLRNNEKAIISFK